VIQSLARARGLITIMGGAWPLASVRSFEGVFGPKHDRWLVKKATGRPILSGVTQLAGTRPVAGVAQVRRLGPGTAAVIATRDAAHGTNSCVSRRCLPDALLELAWNAVWTAVEPDAGTRG